MSGRAFTWVRRFFELAGAISFLGLVVGATVLTILIPAVTGAVLDLPAYLLIVPGIGVFFLALATILAILKAVLERRSVEDTQQTAGTLNTSKRIHTKRWQDLDQGKEEVRTKLQESEQERERLAQENERLTAQKDEALEQPDAEELYKRFYAQPLQKVSEASFVNERVPLDGFHYEHCTFERCTFVYRGEKPFGLSYFETRGNDNIIEAHALGLREFSRLLVALRYIRPEIEVHNDLLPTQDVALGFRFVEVADLSKSR